MNTLPAPDVLSASSSQTSASARGRFNAIVAANVPLCRDHFKLILRLDRFPPSRPGQFIQVACRQLAAQYRPETQFEWSASHPPQFAGLEVGASLAFLRRPFSLGGRRDGKDGVELDLIHRVVGIGTVWLSRLRPGDHLQILGPLGNGFVLPAADQPAIMIGGGVGIPPMIYLAQALAGKRAVVFAGALNRDLLPLTITADSPSPGSDLAEPLYNVAEFAAFGIPAIITTNDGSYGYRGLVTQALEQYLERFFAGSARPPIIYTCGPEPMMKRVVEIAAQRGIESQVAVERSMACGMGTCQSCVIRISKPDPSVPPLAGKDWCYRLACTDGPVFRGADLLW